MTLQEIREQYEEGLRPILTVTKLKEDGYPVVYALLREEQLDRFLDRYHLHRYFPTGDAPYGQKWQCSLDCQGKALDVCFLHIEMDFKEIYPG